VYKDIKGLANRLGLRYVSPHSARKIYAVNRYHQSGNDINKVQKLLNHSDPAVTVLYALADQMQGSTRGAKGRRLS
jgi:integrase